VPGNVADLYVAANSCAIANDDAYDRAFRGWLADNWSSCTSCKSYLQSGGYYNPFAK
jgi:hypothetical protein